MVPFVWPADAPPALVRRPRTADGWPIPWFVAELTAGPVDLRLACGHKRERAYHQRLCWVCGEPLSERIVFVGGPFSVLNRAFGDWASHPDCAVFSAQHCPFLNGRLARRGARAYPEGVQALPGSVEGRAGPVALYVTGWPVRRAPEGIFRPGPPRYLHWYRHGQRVTEAEVRPVLEEHRRLLEALARQAGARAAAGPSWLPGP